MARGVVASRLSLRRLDPDTVIRRYGKLTTKLFAANTQATPVVIPARDEEHDIPACLVSVASSTLPLHPIVVINESHDRTAERAAAMGATVVTINHVRKMGANQLGLKTAIKGNWWPDPEHKVVLFTDADTLLPKRWAETLSRHLLSASISASVNGAAVYGSSVYIHGPSLWADLGQSIHGFYVDIRQLLTHGTPLVRGHTYGILLDPYGIMVRAIDALNPKQMYRDDVTIYNTLKQNGVVMLRCLHPKAIVMTRGDRAHSWSEFQRNVSDSIYEQSTYDQQYQINNEQLSPQGISPTDTPKPKQRIPQP